jgi:hypothetical protein
MKSFTTPILLSVLALACSPSVKQPSPDTALNKKLKAYLTETVDRLNIAGLTVAITRNDSVRTVSKFSLGAFTFGNMLCKIW